MPPLSLDQLIGRLLMVGIRGASPEDPLLHADLDACRDAHVGGIILFDKDLPTGGPRNIISPDQVRALNAHLLEALGNDLLVAIDQEGGAVARLSESRGFEPTISADQFGRLDADGRTRAARRLARQVAQHGFNVNFAPCVDVAVNPDSPIIARKGRAFSADPRLVAACAAAVIDAHHELNMLACLKHFPGHGSALGDTHEVFTDITSVFDPKTELAPYELLLRLPPEQERADMVMTGHLFDSRIDPDHPASLSRVHTTGILRERLGFEGIVVVDSLDMGAVTNRYSPQEAIVLALNAGADLILDCNNAPGPVRPCPAPAQAESIRKALRDGLIEGGEARLRASEGRITRAINRRTARSAQ